MKRVLLWGSLVGLVMLLTWGGHRILSKRMTGKRWDYVLPEMKELAFKLLKKAEEAGLSVIFYDGWRDTQEQLKNIAKGTSFVKNPLNSMHPWGAAVDIVFKNAAGLPSWPNPDIPENMKKWKKLGEIGESLGLTWGGRWKNFDGPHFQLSSVSAKELRTAYNDDPSKLLKKKGLIA